MSTLPQHRLFTGKRIGLYGRAIMSAKQAVFRLRGSPPQAPVFIMGTGRSGTHWLGEILASHPEVQANIEQPPIFEWVTEMAVSPDSESLLFPRATALYATLSYFAAPRIFVDKSHPSIWIAEKLQQSFPSGKFLGIIRDVYPTVASMLQHNEVRYWVENWKKFPVPNRFLGVTTENCAKYEILPTPAKCAVRWLAHKNQLERLQKNLGSQMLFLRYEDMQGDLASSLFLLEKFLGLKTGFSAQRIKSESMDKWKKVLSSEDVASIDSALREFSAEVSE